MPRRPAWEDEVLAKVDRERRESGEREDNYRIKYVRRAVAELGLPWRIANELFKRRELGRLLRCYETEEVES